MSEKNSNIDLSSLKNFSLGPQWENESHKAAEKRNSQEKKRLPLGKKKAHSKKFSKKTNPIDKDWKFKVLPDPIVVDTIKQKLKESGISYSLKEVVDVLIIKKDRLRIKVEPKSNNLLIWKWKTKNSYFITKKDAVNKFIFSAGSSVKFKEVTKGKPVGKFTYIFQCPVTKKYLPPTSLHNFNEIIYAHLFTNNINTSFDKYVSSLLRVECTEKIKSWENADICTIEYFFEGQELKSYSNFTSLEFAVENELFSQFFESHQSIVMNYNELENAEKLLSQKINTFISGDKNWIRELYSNMLVNFKKSKYCVYKKNNVNFIRFNQRKSIKDGALSEISGRILSLISKNTLTSKKDLLVKVRQEHDLDLKQSIPEIRWLVKEGYVNEYSDGTLEQN